MDALLGNKTLNEIANLAAKHKIVPFLGAGSSMKHLGIDWDSLSRELAQEIGIDHVNNLEVAEKYEQKNGKKGLCEFLKKKLIVDEYHEDKDTTPLIVISMGVGLVYTTNQDNVWERCAQKYGRNFKKIVTLADLGNSKPGDLLYIKYHGDLEEANSLVFTSSSYDERIENVDHFLNIRMRSDLLAKSFLFIGYSFRDPNVIKLFAELNAAFRGTLPSSYLIAYFYSPELEELNDRYGVKIIDPVRELDGKYAVEQAFELFLSTLCKKTYFLKSSNEITESFRPSIPSSQTVVTRYEIEAIKFKVHNSPIGEALSFFRATFDDSLIPEPFHEHVCNLFLDLAKQCVNRELSEELNNAAFHLVLDIKYAVTVLAAVKATAQFRGEVKTPLDLFLPHVKNVPDALRPLCTARAIELLQEWNIKIDDTFRRHVTGWIEGYQNLPEKEMVGYVRDQVNYAWSEHTTLENPLSYWARLGNKSPFGKRKTFDDIRKNLIGMLPKKFSKPYEE